MIFAQLSGYRQTLMVEAATLGWPLMRQMAAHYAHDDMSWSCTSQYLFGKDFLVAPVLLISPSFSFSSYYYNYHYYHKPIHISLTSHSPKQTNTLAPTGTFPGSAHPATEFPRSARDLVRGLDSLQRRVPRGQNHIAGDPLRTTPLPYIY